LTANITEEEVDDRIKRAS